MCLLIEREVLVVLSLFRVPIIASRALPDLSANLLAV